LTVSVKVLRRRGPTPTRAITFLDDTIRPGTVALRRSKASLKTSSLPLGPNAIQAEYTPSLGFTPSAATIVEEVRARRSMRKAMLSAEAGKRASIPAASKVPTEGSSSIVTPEDSAASGQIHDRRPDGERQAVPVRDKRSQCRVFADSVQTWGRAVGASSMLRNNLRNGDLG
jgi:hypothetical protein